MLYEAHEDDRDDHVATYAEAFAEYARNIGDQFADHAWLLTDWDVWVPNPHYCGPPQRHPEDDQDYEEVYGPFLPVAAVDYDDIPF
jgi:hypothetical protein